ncbi:MAG: energy transducer TonB [Pyrinomonadaceae bacterium]
MKFLFLTFSLIVLCVANCFAQAKTCDLRLEVSQNEGKAKVEGTEAVTFVSRGVVKNEAKLVDGMPYFADLKEGNYSVAVSKKNYKTTIKRIRLDCSKLANKAFVTQDIWMWSGSSKEKFHFIDSDYDSEIFRKMWVVDLAQEIPKPDYPLAARSVRASGTVAVEVTIDEKGDVISAESISGHPLLAPSAVSVAKKAKFIPSMAKGEPIRVIGIILYNFVP